MNLASSRSLLRAATANGEQSGGIEGDQMMRGLQDKHFTGSVLQNFAKALGFGVRDAIGGIGVSTKAQLDEVG